MNFQIDNRDHSGLATRIDMPSSFAVEFGQNQTKRPWLAPVEVGIIDIAAASAR